MFIRPDWKKPELYKEFLDLKRCNFTAWEFLRRNPEYQKDADDYRDAAAKYRHYYPKSSLEDFEIHMVNHYIFFEKKWGLISPLMTESKNEFNGENFTDSPLGSHRLFHHDVFHGPYVFIPVDISLPLNILQKEIMLHVQFLRQLGVENKTITLQKNRILSPRIYVEQLRILDGFAAGATVQEIGEVLEPRAANDPDSRQREKRIKAAHKAALKTQSDGYRGMIFYGYHLKEKMSRKNKYP